MILYGYGFHVYLNDFIKKHNCKRIMEIGVYDAQNAINMIKSAICNSPASQVEYYGFDFFYNYSKEQIGKKLRVLGCKYQLIKGNSLITLPEVAKSMPLMDIIFIDGGKSYREASSDWKNSSKLMHSRTGVFVHNVNFWGVGKMVDEVPRDRFNVDLFFAPAEDKVALITYNKSKKGACN